MHQKQTRNSESARLIRLRTHLGLSQREFAPEFCVTPSALAQWETGSRAIPGPALRLLQLFESEVHNDEATEQQELTTDSDRILPIGWMPRSAKAAVTGLTWHFLRRRFKNEDANGVGGRVRRLAMHRFAKCLGDAKGVLMKFGQMQSYLNFALSAEEQQVLRQLAQTSAPMSKKMVRALIQQELGDTPCKLFAQWNATPVAVASIGQVHRARLHSGESVAVKIQYPRIVDALKSDLKNIKALDRMYCLIYRGQAAGTIYHTIADHILAEADYRIEAKNQARFRQMYASRDDIDVPAVVPELSSKRVLTTQFREGLELQEFRNQPQWQRDAAGGALWDFFWRSALQHGCYNTDPHPGNFIFNADRVTFIDYGRVQDFSAGFTDRWKRLLRAALERDRDGMIVASRDFGSIPDSSAFDFNYMTRLFYAFYRPWLMDEPFTFTQDYVRHLWRLLHTDNPNKSRTSYTSDMAFLDQLFFGVYGLLAELGATVRCRPTMLELLYEPSASTPAPFSHFELSTLGLGTSFAGSQSDSQKRRKDSVEPGSAHIVSA